MARISPSRFSSIRVIRASAAAAWAVTESARREIVSVSWLIDTVCLCWISATPRKIAVIPARSPSMCSILCSGVMFIVGLVRSNLVSRTDAFGAACQGLDYGASAYRDAGLGQGAEHVVEQGVDYLFGDSLLSGKVETGGQLLGDPQAHRVRNRSAVAVALIG